MPRLQWKWTTQWGKDFDFILRLQKGECTIGAGFAWLDLLTNLERTADHCSNIAGCVIDVAHDNLNLHQSLRELRNDSEDFREHFKEYQHKYTLNRDGLHNSL